MPVLQNLSKSVPYKNAIDIISHSSKYSKIKTSPSKISLDPPLQVTIQRVHTLQNFPTRVAREFHLDFGLFAAKVLVNLVPLLLLEVREVGLLEDVLVDPTVGASLVGHLA